MTPNPKTLDDLLANARHYAEFCMRGTGNLPPTLFLVGSDGKQVMFMPENLVDVEAKDNFAQMSKLRRVTKWGQSQDAPACGCLKTRFAAVSEGSAAERDQTGMIRFCEDAAAVL